MRAVISIASMCLIVLAIAPLSSAQTEPPVTGKSATGKISWEIRPPADNKATETIWLWPGDDKAKATQLGGSGDAFPIGVDFSKDDAWIVVSRHLSSGAFFSFYRKGADGKYVEDKEADGGDGPVNGFFKIEKTVTTDQIDRWSVNFDGWDTGVGPYAFKFSWNARLNKGPDQDFMRYSGWRGVYDLQKHAIVKTLSPGKVFTQTELSEKDLNDDYQKLRNSLDAAGKESLRLEEREWLKKRDALKTPPEKLELTMARVTELEDRISKLNK